MHKPRFTEMEYQDWLNRSVGICLDCHAERGCTEPDAEGYTCDSCGHARVMGLELAIIADELDIVD